MSKPMLSALVTYCLLGLLPLQGMAQATPTLPGSNRSSENRCPPNLNRPCVALVLGGGGARGAAHIGVIEALEAQHVPIDIIVGTSIGAFVGGLYASGKSIDEIHALFTESDWNSAYRDSIGRSATPNRRKRQIDEFALQLDLGFDGRRISLPLGLIQGQGMKALVDSMLGLFPQFPSFDDLVVPFKAVAADIETGEAVVLDKGDLATALQISMSVPGILRPIEYEGRILVDGGIANNLPVDVAKFMGADLVIAVDIGSPPVDRAGLQSGVTVLRQLTGFLTRDNVNYQKSLLSDADLLIEPRINNVTLTSFNRMAEAIPPGFAAATSALQGSTIQQLAVSMNATSMPDTSLQPLPKAAIDEIMLQNNSRLADDYVLRRLGLVAGSEYSSAAIQRGVNRLYGQGSIARVSTSLRETELGNALLVDVNEKEWGPGYLNFKMELEDDFSTFSRYQLGASYRYTNLSPYNAEWFSSVQIGTEKFIDSNLYWPLGNTDYFLSATASYADENYAYVSDRASLGEVKSKRLGSLVGVGWNLSDRLDLLLGANVIDGNAKPPRIIADLIGIDSIDFKQSGAVLQANFDSLDHATFPTEGWRLSTEILRSKDRYLDFNDYSTTIDAEYNGVISRGRHNLRGRVRYQSYLNNNPESLLSSFQLGGFLNLSGISKDTLSGKHVRLFSGVYTYELAAGDFGAIQLPLFIGASLEAGNAWVDKDDIDYGDLITAGSAFVGWKSPLGPAYLGYGRSDTHESSLYLFLGVTF